MVITAKKEYLEKIRYNDMRSMNGKVDESQNDELILRDFRHCL